VQVQHVDMVGPEAPQGSVQRGPQAAGRKRRKARGVWMRHPDLAGEPDTVATAGQQGRKGPLAVGVSGVHLGDPGFEYVVDDSSRRHEVSRVPKGHGAEHKTDIAGAP
jgi:hypothetical protein